MRKYKLKYKSFFTFIRVIVTILLLYIIFRKINLSDTINIIKTANIFYIILALLISFCFHLLYVFRWRFALIQNNVHIKYLTLLKFQFISIFAQNFLPPAIGGDLVKGFLAFKGNPKIRVASSLLICRISGIFALVILVNLSLFTSSPIYKLRWLAIVVLLVITILYIILFNSKIQQWIINIYNSIKINKLKLFEINVFFEKINTYRNKKIIMFLLILSLIIQILPIFTNYFLFRAVYRSIKLIYFFIYVPLIIFISMIPISINGLGIREGLYFYFFKSIVESDSTLMAFIVLSLFIRILFSFIGGILMILKQTTDN